MKNRYAIVLLLFLPLIACKDPVYTKYYYGKENRRSFICGWDHYIVVEHLGDSLQIWNLDDECNAGYWSTDNIKIKKAEGTYGNIIVKSIEEKNIFMNLRNGRGFEEYKLSRQEKNEDAYRVINIIQMLQIDEEVEAYIQSNSSNAEKHTNYLPIEYYQEIQSGKVEKLTPQDFKEYYKLKRIKLAEKEIEELSRN